MAKRSPATGIRKHGRFYELNMQRNGKRYFINLETEDFAEAVRRATEIRANPELTPGSTLLAEIERFITYKLRMKVYTEHTARTKRNKLKLLAEFVPTGTSAATITGRQLQQWHDAMLKEATSPTTISGYFMAAQAFFRWAVEVERLRRTNPVKEVKIVKSEGRARESFCDYDLRDRLIASAPDDDMKFILYCGFHAGLRFNEIVQARPFWFDIPGKRLVLRKTPTMKFKDREERTIPMTEEFRDFLKRYGLKDPFMLRPEVEQGKWLYRYDFRKSFMAYMEAQGCPWVTPHVMRHTFASLLVSAGESIYKVAVWMGDEVTTVQKHYGHLAPDHGGIEKAFSRRHRDNPSSSTGSGNSPLDSRSQA